MRYVKHFFCNRQPTDTWHTSTHSIKANKHGWSWQVKGDISKHQRPRTSVSIFHYHAKTSWHFPQAIKLEEQTEPLSTWSVCEVFLFQINNANPRNLLLIPTNPLRWRKFAFHETRLFDETDRCRGLQGDLGNGGEHYPEIQGWPVRTDLNRNVELCKQKNVDKKHKPTAAQKVRDEGMGWEKTFSLFIFFKENLSSAKPSA